MIRVTSSVTDQMWRMGTIKWHSSLLFLRYGCETWPGKCFFKDHPDVTMKMALGYKKSSVHHLILQEISVKFCHNQSMNPWVMTKMSFVRSQWPLTTKIRLANPRVQVIVCVKCEEIPSRCSWDIVFMWAGRLDGKPKNIMSLATAVTRRDA